MWWGQLLKTLHLGVGLFRFARHIVMMRRVSGDADLRRLRAEIIQQQIDRKFAYTLGFIDAKLIYNEPTVTFWINDSGPLTILVIQQKGIGETIYTSNADHLEDLHQIFDWKKEFRATFPSDLFPAIDAMVRRCGTQMKMDVCVYGECYEATRETLADMPLAPGYRFDDLGLAQAEEVNDRWEYSEGKATLPIVQTAIKYFPSVCVRDQAGDLAAFEIISGCCNMAVLYVYPEHRCKGLGAAVTCELARKMIEKRGMAFLHITTYNDVSRALHKRCGFRQMTGGSTCWTTYNPIHQDQDSASNSAN